MANYISDEEMNRRQAALANFSNGASIQDAWMSLQPKYVSRYAKPTTVSNALPGKVMPSRFGGCCVDCGGYIAQGAMMRYDGKVHHTEPRFCQDGHDEDDNAAERIAEQRNEAWFEERGHWEDDRQERELWALEERYDREDQDRADAVSLAQDLAPATPATLADGKWTLQFPDGHHRTFKIHTAKTGSLAGKRIIKYLAKQDNMDENSYIGFAFYNAGKVQVWSRFKGDTALNREAQLLNDVEAAKSAGKAYALASNCCYRCGHDLTDPTSIEAGLGPDCRKAVNF